MADYSFILENDPALIPPLIARLREAAMQLRLFDEPTADRVDVALNEAMINGIHHGNLELDSRFRQEDDAASRHQVEERRRRSPYRDRRLHVRVRLSRAESVYIIRDEGPGFDPAALPDPTDPANLEKASGRGLFLIRAFMDEVTFNPTANQITLIKRRQEVAPVTSSPLAPGRSGRPRPPSPQATAPTIAPVPITTTSDSRPIS